MYIIILICSTQIRLGAVSNGSEPSSIGSEPSSNGLEPCSNGSEPSSNGSESLTLSFLSSLSLYSYRPYLPYLYLPYLYLLIFLIFIFLSWQVLFSAVDKLLHRKPEKRYPTASSTTELVNKFADFFSNKIAIIRKELAIDSSHCNQRNQEEQYAQCVKFINFQEVTEHEIKNAVDKVGKKSCELDPVPAKIFQGCQKTLLPIITKISNESLQSGCMPEKLKEAVLKPKLY